MNLIVDNNLIPRRDPPTGAKAVTGRGAWYQPRARFTNQYPLGVRTLRERRRWRVTTGLPQEPRWRLAFGHQWLRWQEPPASNAAGSTSTGFRGPKEGVAAVLGSCLLVCRRARFVAVSSAGIMPACMVDPGSLALLEFESVWKRRCAAWFAASLVTNLLNFASLAGAT